MKRLLQWIAAIILAVALVNTCDSYQRYRGISKPSETPVTQQVAIPTAREKTIPGWRYDAEQDQMTGKRAFYAFTESPEKLHFKFPYAGGSTATLTLRKHPRHGTDAFISVSKGQFKCGLECTVLVKIDDASPTTYRATPPSDGSSDTLFISPHNKLIQHLKKANRAIIEAEFYQEGSRAIHFNVSDLQTP